MTSCSHKGVKMLLGVFPNLRGVCMRFETQDEVFSIFVVDSPS